MRTKTKAWVNLGFFLLTIGVNTLGAFGYINGLSQKVVSDRYPTLITPSPATFSIWGIIYTLLLVSIVFMIVKSRDTKVAAIIERISLPFWVSCAANILWIITFSFEWIGISTLLIFLLVISLAVLNGRLKAPEGIGQKVNALAFGLYNGWLIIASVVNAAAFLVQAKWDGFGLGQDTWAVIILIAALLITSLIQMRLRNAALPLPLAWACYGIWQQHRAEGFFTGQYPAVATVSVIVGIAFVMIAVFVFMLNKRCLLPKTV